ncbi:MAG: hypothetical protein KC468_36205 [Myxococcales bacterium]|nr:hypothetical protein [Myxococcales bacterium]
MRDAPRWIYAVDHNCPPISIDVSISSRGLIGVGTIRAKAACARLVGGERVMKSSAALPSVGGGYNHNIMFRGRVLHVQTERAASVALRVDTHLFFAGRILATRRRTLADSTTSRELQLAMKAQHRELIRDLIGGRVVLPADFSSGVAAPDAASPGDELRGRLPVARVSPPAAPQRSIPPRRARESSGSLATVTPLPRASTTSRRPLPPRLDAALSRIRSAPGAPDRVAALRQVGVALAVLRGAELDVGVELARDLEHLQQRLLLELTRSRAAPSAPLDQSMTHSWLALANDLERRLAG